MRKYDIGFFCLGNGVTVCNRAVMQNGDYKIIAHISAGGNVDYRENKERMPTYIIEAIEDMADSERKKYREYFCNLPKGRQYDIMLENMPYGSHRKYDDSWDRDFEAFRDEYFGKYA